MSSATPRMTDRERSVALSVFLVLTMLVTALIVFKLGTAKGDTAIFYQLTENIAEGAGPTSQIFQDTTSYVFSSDLLNQPAAVVAKDPLRPLATATDDPLRGHAYYILFLLAPLTRIVPVAVLFAALFALSFVGMVAVAYFALRRCGIGIPASALFCVLVITHPAWSQSLFDGQFYPDRLFVGAGALFAYLLYARRDSRVGIIVAAVLCALINERGALIAGIFAVGYAILYWKELRDRVFTLCVGVGLLVYSVFLVKVVLSNIIYGTYFISVADVLGHFHDVQFVERALLLVLVCSPFVVLALFAPRMALIAAVCILPNILGNIGGAEKIGWSTHYPSYYLPILVMAALAGFVNLWRKAKTANVPAIPYVALGVMILGLSMLDPASYAGVRISPDQLSNQFLLRFPRELATYYGPAGRELDGEAADVSRVIPPGARVSSIESGMPFLYRGRTIHYFPTGIDQAQYAVVSASGMDGGRTYGGVLSFLGRQEAAKANDLIFARMRRDGYDFDRARYYPMLGLAIIKHGRPAKESEQHAQ